MHLILGEYIRGIEYFNIDKISGQKKKQFIINAPKGKRIFKNMFLRDISSTKTSIPLIRVCYYLFQTMANDIIAKRLRFLPKVGCQRLPPGEKALV